MNFIDYCEAFRVSEDDVQVVIAGCEFYISRRLYLDFVKATIKNDVSARDMLEHVLEKALNDYLTWYELDSDPVGDGSPT